MLSRKLESMGAVLVEGPKWCGKTTTCKQFAKSVLDLSDPDVLDRVTALAEIDIKRFLEGDTPRLIGRAICLTTLPHSAFCLKRWPCATSASMRMQLEAA